MYQKFTQGVFRRAVFGRSLLKCRNAQSTVRRKFSTITNGAVDSNPFITAKDALRLGATFSMCGTVAAYMDLKYKSDAVVFKIAVPTPERFVLFACVWGIAGMASWLLFWARPERVLLQAANGFKTYGFAEGIVTSTIAMGFALATIGSMSLYFDYAEYKATPTAKNYEASGGTLQTMALASAPPSNGGANDHLKTSAESSVSGCVTGVDSANDSDAQLMDVSSEEFVPGFWDWRKAWKHACVPCREFARSNAALWLVCGIPFAVLASKVMAARIAITAASMAATPAVCSLSLCVDIDSLQTEMKRRAQEFESVMGVCDSDDC